MTFELLLPHLKRSSSIFSKSISHIISMLSAKIMGAQKIYFTLTCNFTTMTLQTLFFFYVTIITAHAYLPKSYACIRYIFMYLTKRIFIPMYMYYIYILNQMSFNIHVHEETLC